jgi:selenide,water dikinase
VIVGGHSIDDPEPKYGLSVLGTAHPDAILTNAGGRPGDVLTLSKPLGVGAITTAAKRGAAAAGLVQRAVEVMAELNAQAADAARAAGARAATDVTGFGLLGHLHELARASGCAAVLDAAAVPAIEGVSFDGAVAGGTRRNRQDAERFATFAPRVSEERRWLVCDATTSGGILSAGPAPAMGPVIGRLVEGAPGAIEVR